MTFRVRFKESFSSERYKNMTVNELNDAGKSGRNELMTVASTPEGRRMIADDEVFRQKITSEGFCLRAGSMSAAGHFLTSEDGLRILLDHSDLAAKLTADSLNARSINLEEPKVFWVARYKAGIELLANPAVRQLVSVKGLNARCMYLSALYYLTTSDDGIALLADVNFRKKIRPKTLNVYEEHEGHSVVANLCQSEKGREALLQYKDLLKMIEPAAFNARLRGCSSPLFHLTRTATGLDVLASSRHLRSLININSLNLACVYGPDKGTSPLFWLVSSEAGRAILMCDKRLRSLIEVRDLRVMREADKVSVADLLLLPECAALLKKLDKNLQAYVAEHRKMRDDNIPGWHASAVLFKPQKKSPQMAEEIVVEKRCVIL